MKSRPNIPSSNPPKTSTQIQTDVKMIDHSHFFQFEKSPLEFSHLYNGEYGLLNARSVRSSLELIKKEINKFKNIQKIQGISESQLKNRLQWLQLQIEGLLRREIKYKSQGQDKNYYLMMCQLEQKLDKQIIINNNYQIKLKKNKQRIQQLQNQISKLNTIQFEKDNLLTENELLKQTFIKLNQSLKDQKKIKDFETYLKKQVNPVLNEFKIQTTDLNKKIITFKGKLDDQKTKFKFHVNNLINNLDKIFKSQQQIAPQNIQKVTIEFLTSLNIPYQQNLFRNDGTPYKYLYQDLKEKFESFYSITLSKFKESLLKYNDLNETFKMEELEKIKFDLELNIFADSKYIIVSHHGHGQYKSVSVEDSKTRNLIRLLIDQFKIIFQKYPKLQQMINPNLLDYINQKILLQASEREQLQRITQVIKYKPEIVRVDNIYTLNQDKNLKEIFHLKVFVKVLIDQLNKIVERTGSPIQIDEGIFNMIKQQTINLPDADTLLRNFRSTPRIVEVDRIIQQDVGKYQTLTQSHPIRVQQSIVVQKLRQVPVKITQYVVVQNQKLVQYNTVKQQAVIHKVQVPMQIDRNVQVVVQRIIQKQVIKEVQTFKQIPLIQKQVQEIDKVIIEDRIVEVPKQVKVEIACPVKHIDVKIVEVERFEERLVPVIHQVNNIQEIKVNIPYPVQQIKYVQVQNIKNNFIPYPQIKQIIKQVACKIEHTREIPVTCIETIQKIVVQKDIQEIIKQVVVSKQVPIIQQKIITYPQQVFHITKGDKQQKIIQVQRIKEVPIIQQRIVSKEIEVQKMVPVYTTQQIPIIVQLNLPYIQYEPQIINCEIQKVIPLKQMIPYQVIREIPVPIIIQKESIKPVRVTIQKFVEKIVQVPRVVEIQKIVQKIVVVPRIIQQIVAIPQIVQVVVQKQVQVLKIVQIEKPYPVYITKQIIKVVEQKVQIPVTKTEYQIVQKQKLVTLKKVIQKIKEVELQKRIPYEIIQQIPVQIILEKIVQKIIEIHTIDVKDRQVIKPYRFEVPIQIHQEVAVPIQSIIENIVQVSQTITKPQILYQTKKQLEIKQIFIQKPVERIKEVVYTDVKHLIENQITYLEVPPKQICVVSNQIINKLQPQPYIVQKLVYINNIHEKGIQVKCQKPVIMRENILVPVEKPVNYIETRQVARHFTKDRVVETKTNIQTIKTVELQGRQKIVTIEKMLPPQIRNITQQLIVEIKSEIVKIIQKILPIKQEVIKEIQVPGQSIITEQIKQVPVDKPQLIIQKVIEKISLLPQIVQVVKNHYQISVQKNLNVCKEDPRLHKQNYKGLLNQMKTQLALNLKFFKQDENPQEQKIANIEKLLDLIQNFLQFPLIIEVPVQVQKIVQKQRIITVPYKDQQATEIQLASSTLIQKLINEIKRIVSTYDVELEVDQSIKNIFFVDLKTSLNLQDKLKLFSSAVIQRFQKLGSWTSDHSDMLNEFLQERFLMAAIIREANDNISDLKQQLERSQYNQQKMRQVIDKLNINNISLRQNLDGLTNNINQMMRDSSYQERRQLQRKIYSGIIDYSDSSDKTDRGDKIKIKQLEQQIILIKQKNQEQIYEMVNEINGLNTQIKKLQSGTIQTQKIQAQSQYKTKYLSNQKELKQLKRKLQKKQNEYNNSLIQFDRIKQVNKQLQYIIENSHRESEGLKINNKELQIKVEQLQNRVKQLEEQLQSPEKLSASKISKLLQSKTKAKQQLTPEDPKQYKQKKQSTGKNLEKEFQQAAFQSPQVTKPKESEKKFPYTTSKLEDVIVQEPSQEQSSSSKITVLSPKPIAVTKRNVTVRQLINQNTLNEHESTQIIKKLIEKISEEVQKKKFSIIIPQIIFLIGYHPQSIDKVKIQISVISQKNKQIQKQYLSPENARGESGTQKSSVFNLGIIWDQLLHGELYFKNNDQLLSSSYDYKVRNNKINAIYKNILMQMLNKDSKIRIDLSEVKRKLSFQKF